MNIHNYVGSPDTSSEHKADDNVCDFLLLLTVIMLMTVNFCGLVSRAGL